MKCKTCHRWWLVFLITCKNCKGWSESWPLHWDGTDANHFPYAQCIKMQHALKQHKHIIILIMSPFSLLDSAERDRKRFADPFTLQYFVTSLSLEHKNVTLPWQKTIHSCTFAISSVASAGKWSSMASPQVVCISSVQLDTFLWPLVLVISCELGYCTQLPKGKTNMDKMTWFLYIFESCTFYFLQG